MAGNRGKLCPETFRPRVWPLILRLHDEKHACLASLSPAVATASSLSVRHDRGARPYPGYPQLVESAHQPQPQLFGQREDHVLRLALQFADPAGA